MIMKLFFAFFLFLIILTPLLFYKIAYASVGGSIECTVKVSICGNIAKEEGEDCDNSDLGGQTCQSRGFSGGVLICNIDCTFDTSQCTRGGGGGTFNPSGNLTDANKDNRVDLLDFNILMVNWGAVGPNIADFNGDNVIDLSDFNLLMIYWTI